MLAQSRSGGLSGADAAPLAVLDPPLAALDRPLKVLV